MFVSVGEFDVAYKRIKQDSLKGDCTVLIFVAPDTDSVCACSILTSLLKGDFIKYKMIPVADESDLELARDLLVQSAGDLQSVVMLNAGGTIDILEVFQADEGDALSEVTFYIVDSHRPCELSNVYEPDRVVLFDDGETQKAIPDADEVWNMSDSEDDDEEDDNNDDTNADGERASKRRRQEDGSMSPRSRRLKRADRDTRREEYYKTTSYGVAASVLMWQLVGDMGKSDNHLLWLAIAGLTDQLIQERIGSAKYYEGVQRLSDDVRRMNAMEDENDQEVMDRMQIKQVEELRFMLLRHWTVMKAMKHSRYIATRLAVWKQSGQKLLKNLLAKMGLSIEQCEQQYSAMDVRHKKQLMNQVLRYKDDYNLENCVFPSFVSQSGFRDQYSASDLVYTITGLLEAPANDIDQQIDWKKNFFDALDALSMKNKALLQKGADNSKKQHLALVRQVENVIEGKTGRKAGNLFRYVIIKDDPDQKYFIHHPTLRRLGLFLMDTYRFSKDRKRTFPLVLAALNPATETYVVVGMWSNLHRAEGTVPKNNFGRHFQKAGERVEARVRQAAFESTILEVKSDDMMQFISALQHTLQPVY
eukprot:m.62716 g.62716  ORF g.62716 m.62716 type:complete len:589 (-) comp23192_c0_seq1:164-1930(-)